MTQVGELPESNRSTILHGWQVQTGPLGVKVSRASGLAPEPAPRENGPVLEDRLPPPIGRHHEIAAVVDALRTVSFAEVWGACGIGKTTLLRHLADRVTSLIGIVETAEECHAPRDRNRSERRRSGGERTRGLHRRAGDSAGACCAGRTS
jgi:hypothetical protein